MSNGNEYRGSLRALIERTALSVIVPSGLRKLEEDEIARALAILDYLKRAGLRNGKTAQELLSSALKPGFTEESIGALFKERCGVRLSLRRWKNCLIRAQEKASGGSVHVLEFDFSCRYLFGRWNDLLSKIPKVGFFNSRVPRIIDPDEPWFEAFRYALSELRDLRCITVTSTGTFAYDAVRVWAYDNEKEALTVLPHPYKARKSEEERPALSCCLWPFRCDRRVMMKCRDRIVARISDIMVVVFLRSGSTLKEAIRENAISHEKPVFVWKPSLENFSSSRTISNVIPWEIPEKGRKVKEKISIKHVSGFLRPDDSFPFERYLYHYTRTTYGPGPHESREDYIRRLLRGDECASNTAVDVLIQIARDGFIRPHGGMVKDGTPVISWTSLPPHEASKVRRWNPASIRWTLGHCGIAVRKSLLKQAGAKPVCYIPLRFYDRLPESERYRFQKHEPPTTTWKCEKEWRLKGALDIRTLATGDAFWFFTDESDAQKFVSLIDPILPVYLFEGQEIRR